MIDKYLPIGTVCTLKGNNKKVMVIGFFSVEYNGNIKMYDYQGCAYPEGILLKNRLISFNHDDIERIDYLGFKDILHDNFNKILIAQNGKIDQENDKVTTVSNFQFDENGVVIFDGTLTKQDNQTNVSGVNTPQVVDNPFKMDYKPEDRNVNQDQQKILNSYIFDANGVVISDGITNNNLESTANTPQESRYEFDANGVVISDGTTNNNLESTANMPQESRYEFDANGVVVSDGTTNNNLESTANMPQESRYEFDANGVVVSDGTTNNNLESTANMPQESRYEFDANGVVISDGTINNNSSTLEENSTNN